MRHIPALLLLSSVALLALSCQGKKSPQNSVIPNVLVKVAPSTQSEVEQITQFTGTIQPYLQNTITPSIPVRIDDVLVDVGARVQKGQLVVKMDPTQYRQSAVQLAQLETDLARMKAVYEASGISKQQLDAQNVQVEVSRQAADNLLTNIELRSPITGIVTARYYDPGDMYLSAGKNGQTGILTIMQIDRLKVEINVSEQYFPQVKMGMPVDITLDLFPKELFPAKVTLIYPAIDPSTRTFTTEITIPNATQKLRPGMFSRVSLNFGKAQRVMIPDIALQKQQGTNERFVYVVGDSTAQRRTVQVGRQIGDRYEVLSGVELGEQVVTAGASKLMDNSPVSLSK